MKTISFLAVIAVTLGISEAASIGLVRRGAPPEPAPPTPQPIPKCHPKTDGTQVTPVQPQPENPPSSSLRSRPVDPIPLPAPAPVPQPAPPPSFIGNGFKSGILFVHNAARAVAGVAPLQWSDALAVEAKGWSDEQARVGKMFHATNNNGHGENLWWCKGCSIGDHLGTHAAKDWANEIAIWISQGRPRIGDGDFKAYGHYTQVVDRDTKYLGCDYTVKGEEVFLTCRMFPFLLTKRL